MKIKQDKYRRNILRALTPGAKTITQLYEYFGESLPIRKGSRTIERAVLYYYQRSWLSRKKVAIRYGTKRATGEHIYEWMYSLTTAGRALQDYLDKLDNLQAGEEAYISKGEFEITDDYLRGFFDGEGSLEVSRYKNSYRTQLSFSNTCLPLMEAIFEYLRGRGFHPSIYYRTPKKEGHKSYSIISFSNFANIEHWFSTIGSCHPLKLKKWEELKSIKADRIGINYPRYRNANHHS